MQTEAALMLFSGVLRISRRTWCPTKRHDSCRKHLVGPMREAMRKPEDTTGYVCLRADAEAARARIETMLKLHCAACGGCVLAKP